jgi:hypothetical protein
MIDSHKFKTFCHDTAKMFVSLYSWYKMPVSLHKILIHSYQIVQVFPLPLGAFSEESAEARNKFYRRDRLNHARKSSRENNMKDLFNYQMYSSDPVISNMSLTRFKTIKKNIPIEVQELLLDDNNNGLNANTVDDYEEELDSIEFESVINDN